MKQTVGVAEMAISTSTDDTLVTHALGSCLGLTVHDPVAAVGGLLHVMLPDSTINTEKASANPFMFVDTGVPRFFRQLYEAGAVKQRLVVKVAGGAAIRSGEDDRLNIGKRNYMMLRKLFWKNGVMISAEDIGGSAPRTVYFEIASGRVRISSAGEEWDL
jgi:chemotaxis protein CheD